jgi:hypothetical protein
VLVTALTKRLAEDLTQYFAELGVRVRCPHSEVETLERTAILAGLVAARDVRRAGADQHGGRGGRLNTLRREARLALQLISRRGVPRGSQSPIGVSRDAPNVLERASRRWGC